MTTHTMPAMATAWFPWLVFLFLTTIVAMQWGLPGELGRAICAVLWFLILLACVLRLV